MNCYALNCGTRDGAARSQGILADACPNLRVKRHRQKRFLLLVWCASGELPGVRDAIQSALVMTALEPKPARPWINAFKQTTVSGRISSERLNMQQITQRPRDMPKSLHKHEWFAAPIAQVHDEVLVDVKHVKDAPDVSARETLMELMRRFKP